MKMDPIINSSPILPNGFNSTDPETLFRLFFDNRILERIVRYTNLNTALKHHRIPWKPVSNNDILSYIGILVFFSLEKAIE
jgi:hypothetical protein